MYVFKFDTQIHPWNATSNSQEEAYKSLSGRVGVRKEVMDEPCLALPDY